MTRPILNGEQELLGELKARLRRWQGRRRHGRIDLRVNVVAGEIADFRIEEGDMTDMDWERVMREKPRKAANRAGVVK